MKLEDIERSQHPFNVPKGYFDDLGEAISAKTTSPNNTSPLWSIFNVYRWQLASAVIVSCCLLVFLSLPSEKVSPNFLAGISDEEIIVYLASYELNEDEIIGVLSASEVEVLFESEDVLNGIDVQEESIDDLLLEHGLIDEIVEI